MKRQKDHLFIPALVLAGAALILGGCSGGSDTVDETQAVLVHDMEAESIDQLSYGAGDSADWNNIISENKISKDFSEALADFSFQAAGSLLNGTEDNLVFSPVSIYSSLALAETGSEGETRDELDLLLGMSDADELSKQCNKLMLQLNYTQQRYKAQARAMGAYGYQSDIILANSLWFSNALTVKEEYQENAAKNFYASSYSVNFENPDSAARIQYWVRDNTKGVISPKITIPSGTLMTLVNTLYCYGAWDTPFDEEQSVEDFFVKEDGESFVIATYCCRTQMQGSVNTGEGYMISSLPTDNGCEMVILLPDEEHTVDEFLQTPEDLRLMMEKKPDTECMLEWKIPKFSFGSSLSLKSSLKKMGIDAMFSKDADFSLISDEDLYVSEVLHEAHISLDEQGVEGAAYTLITMNETALMPDLETYQMICNHPFIFGIREKNSGVWLFIGVCRDPSAV